MIDLRSDTVTQPDDTMRKVMFEAPVGDDVYGEDPTINELERLAAEMTGMDEGLFVPSGTQANLLALLSHCERGDEYIAGQDAHNYKYEGGGAAIIGGIQPQPLDFNPDGTIELEKVKKVIKPKDPHFANTRLLSLENTQGGKVLPYEYMASARDFVDEHNLNLHLDGARVFNAVVQSGKSIGEIAELFDSISICLSKGLGAPVGSLLCGSSEIVQKARRWRKVVGGGMRQAGILASAGIYALTNNVQRLEEDHKNAAILADGLSTIQGIQIESAQTNMVFFKLTSGESSALINHMKEQGVLIQGRDSFRLVTHLNVSREDIEKVIKAFQSFS